MVKNKFKYFLKKIIRHGFDFKFIFKDLEKSQYFSAEQLDELHNKKLQKLVSHCYKNVPYYTDLFDKLNLKPEDIKTKGDLKKLPYLDKNIVKDNFNKLIAKNKFKHLCNVAETSGSTGTPLKLLRDYHSINFESAALHRHYNKVSNFDNKKITLRGQVIPVNKEKNVFWEFNSVDNELIMSSYHLSEKTAEEYLDKIKAFNPSIIFAYPSSLYLLAKYAEAFDYKFEFDAIFTSSEKLKDYQRDFIEKVFNCKIYDWYGQAERVAAIGQCKNGTYHIIEDYSIVETIQNEDGYELVGTNLDNYVMPLLRYKTGDNVELSSKKCDCGCKFRTVSEIYGREENCIMTINGPQVAAFDQIPRGVSNILETQFIQDKLGELIINITTNNDFSQNDKEKLLRNAFDRIPADIKVVVNQVSEIPRGANGKFVAVINKLIGDKSGE